MNAMLTDDDLARLLGEAAESFEVPAEGPPRIQKDLTPVLPLRQRAVFKVGTAAAALLVLSLGVAQLGGGSTAGTSASKTSAPDVQRPVAGLDSGPTTQGGGATSGHVGANQDRVGAPTAPTAAEGVDGADARVVKTGTITLQADKGKVGTTIAQAKTALVGVRGYVASENSQPIGDNPTATVTMRVPVASFEALEKQLQKLGAKVVSVTSTGKDVTATFADTGAQIASLKAARARFLTILAGANTIGETLTVQQRVDDVQSQIDRLEGQRRLLESQSDLATLTITVSEKPPAAVKTQRQSGIGKAWDSAKDGFSSGINGLISRSGRALVVLLFLGVAAVVLRFGWRFARRRMV